MEESASTVSNENDVQTQDENIFKGSSVSPIVIDSQEQKNPLAVTQCISNQPEEPFDKPLTTAESQLPQWQTASQLLEKNLKDKEKELISMMSTTPASEEILSKKSSTLIPQLLSGILYCLTAVLFILLMKYL